MPIAGQPFRYGKKMAQVVSQAPKGTRGPRSQAAILASQARRNKQQFARGTAGRPSRQSILSSSRTRAAHSVDPTAPVSVKMGPTRYRGHSVDPTAPVSVKMGPTQNKPIQESAKPGGRMTGRTKMLLGIGGAAAVGTVMNRRGSGSSSGRQSAYGY